MSAAVTAGWIRPLLAAVLIGVALAGLDLLGSDFWASHPMLGQAIGGLFLFAQGGLLLPRLLAYRDEQRQRKVSEIAYAALAQSANDAGRRLLAPLNGADLFSLGILAADREPGMRQSAVAANVKRLRANGFEPTFNENAGTWNRQHEVLAGRLERLLDDQEFVQALFRTVSRLRRELHAAAAEWAPTMFGDSERTADLREFQELIAAFHSLQQALRSALTPADRSTLPSESADVVRCFWRAVDEYERIRDHFDSKGVHERTAACRLT